MGNTHAKREKTKGRSLSRTSTMNPNSYWFLAPFRENDKILALRIDPDKVNKTHFIFDKLINKSQYGEVWVARKLPSLQ